jgi:hypothetical protein
MGQLDTRKKPGSGKGPQVPSRLDYTGDNKIHIGTVRMISDSDRLIAKHFNPSQMLGRDENTVTDKSMGVELDHDGNLSWLMEAILPLSEC